MRSQALTNSAAAQQRRIAKERDYESRMADEHNARDVWLRDDEQRQADLRKSFGLMEVAHHSNLQLEPGSGMFLGEFSIAEGGIALVYRYIALEMRKFPEGRKDKTGFRFPLTEAWEQTERYLEEGSPKTTLKHGGRTFNRRHDFTQTVESDGGLSSITILWQIFTPSAATSASPEQATSGQRSLSKYVAGKRDFKAVVTRSGKRALGFGF